LREGFGGDPRLGDNSDDVWAADGSRQTSWQQCAPSAAASIRPNGWLVQGFNDDGAAVVVRPWVICADIDQLAHAWPNVRPCDLDVGRG
jgi:hypothetical protein